MLWFRLLQTNEGASVKQNIEQNSTSGSCYLSGSCLSTHLTRELIIESTMWWTGYASKAAMMASLMGLLEKNTTITNLDIQRNDIDEHKRNGALVLFLHRVMDSERRSTCPERTAEE